MKKKKNPNRFSCTQRSNLGWKCIRSTGDSKEDTAALPTHQTLWWIFWITAHKASSWMRRHQWANVQHAALEHWRWFTATKKAAVKVQLWEQENQKNPEKNCGRMTHTGVDHCLGLLRGARRNVGQSPGCLELERRAAGEREREKRMKQSKSKDLWWLIYNAVVTCHLCPGSSPVWEGCQIGWGHLWGGYGHLTAAS